MYRNIWPLLHKLFSKIWDLCNFQITYRSYCKGEELVFSNRKKTLHGSFFSLFRSRDGYLIGFLSLLGLIQPRTKETRWLEFRSLKYLRWQRCRPRSARHAGPAHGGRCGGTSSNSLHSGHGWQLCPRRVGCGLIVGIQSEASGQRRTPGASANKWHVETACSVRAACSTRCGSAAMPLASSRGAWAVQTTDLSSLVAPFDRQQIDLVVRSLHSDKAPGPDGFNTDFTKKCWPIIYEDFYRLCNAFYSGAIC